MSIQTHQNVSLVPLDTSHAAQTFAWVCDPTISRNIGLRSTPSLEKTISWVENAREAEDIEAFAILLDGAHVGNVTLDRIDTHLSSARLSIYIGSGAARGLGVGRAAMQLVLEHGFRKLHLRKIWLTVHVRNVAAIQTYVRSGFVVEGVMRDEFRLDDEFVSVLYMGVLADEFYRGAKR